MDSAKPSPPQGTLVKEGQKPSLPNVPKSAQYSAQDVFAEFEKRGIDIGSILLDKMIQNTKPEVPKKWLIAISIIVGLFVVALVAGTIWVSATINRMNTSYIQQTNQIIFSKTQIETTAAWDKLPTAQKKEKLREQYYAIIRYYTNNLPDNQKMSDEQILQSFNQMWLCTERLNMNFFLPIAFMKTLTNFNPYFQENSRIGMGYFYLKNAEQIANLPLVRNDPVFALEYKGSGSLNNPIDAIKLLVARIDDLLKTFQGREDWVFLALVTNEYDVIAKYWKDGSGAIPDSFYLKGKLADCLKNYQCFKNWEIPKK